MGPARAHFHSVSICSKNDLLFSCIFFQVTFTAILLNCYKLLKWAKKEKKHSFSFVSLYVYFLSFLSFSLLRTPKKRRHYSQQRHYEWRFCTELSTVQTHCTMEPSGLAEGSSKMYCGQCHVLTWMGLIIQRVYGSFCVGTQGNGYSKKQNLTDTLCTTKSDIKQINVLPTQCIGVFRLDIRSYRDYFPVQH